MAVRFFLYQALVALPFVAGYALKRLRPTLEGRARDVLKWNLVVLESAIVVLVFWGIQFEAKLLQLPIIGFVSSLFGMALAAGIARVAFPKMDAKSAGSFIFAGGLSNQGYTLGSCLCMMLFGLKGLELAMTFILYFHFLAFLICFPMARTFSGEGKSSLGEILATSATDIRTLPLAALAMGLILNGAGIPRPHAVETILKTLVPAGVGIAMFGIGMSMRFSKMKECLPQLAGLCGVKFVGIPASALALILAFRLEGLARDVAFTLSFMPAGVYSVVISNLFGLNPGLAGAAFVATTLTFLAVPLPLLWIHFAGF